MEQTLRQLGERLLGAVPTAILLGTLYILRLPSAADVAERRSRTRDARRHCSRRSRPLTTSNACAKRARHLQEPGNRRQEATQSRSQRRIKRTRAQDQVKQARAFMEEDKREAMSKLQSEAARLATDIVRRAPPHGIAQPGGWWPMKMKRELVEGEQVWPTPPSARCSRSALSEFSLGVPLRSFAYAHEQSAAQPSQQAPAGPPQKELNQPTPERTIGGELAEETREAEGEGEENVKAKTCRARLLAGAQKGLSVHQAHTAACLNFAIIVIVFWAVRKFVPGILRNRSASIQQALQEARTASQYANRGWRTSKSSAPVGCRNRTDAGHCRKGSRKPRTPAFRKPPKRTFVRSRWWNS